MEFSSRQLRGFHLVAQHRSFSRAAEAMFITPSGLSVLIRELEHQLGFRLFDRTTRSVELTAYGVELLEVTRRSVQDLDAAMARLGRAAKGIGPPVSVGVTPLMAANVLPRAVREFRALRPDLRVQLFDGDLKAILRRVEVGKLDMGLGIFKSVPGIRRIPFFRFSLVLVRPPQEAAGPRATTAWGTLDGQSLIALSADNPLQQLIDRELAGAGIACPKDAVVNLLDTQIALVEAGQGMAIIPSFGLAVTRHRQVSVSQLVPAVHLDYHQITRRARQPSPAATEFASFLKGHMARWAGTAGVA